MKKLLLTLICCIVLFNLVQAQINWIDHKIDDKLSVKLPPKRDTTTAEGVIAHTTDSLICFAYKIIDTDSATMAKAISLPGFLDGLKASIARSKKGIVLGEVSSGKWHGYDCYNVEGTYPPIGAKASFYFLIIGGRVYMLGASMPANHDINEKNLFFNTLKLN